MTDAFSPAADLAADDATVPDAAAAEGSPEFEHSLTARKIAARWLEGVTRLKRPLDELVDQDPDLDRLETRDRAFAKLLILTLLRRLRQIDRLIDRCMDREPPRQGPTRDALRLGCAQLLFIGTPPHAAVKSSVALVRRLGAPQHDKLVNAVLRRLAVEGPKMARRQDAGRLAMPEWLWEEWSESFGADTARAIGEALLAEPTLDFSAKGDPHAWAAPLEAKVLATGTLRRPLGGEVTALPGYAEGAWWVQDAAAALPVKLFGPVAGRDALDLCAAPGGKTAQLAAAGARVTAVDRSPNRMRRLAANLARLGLEAEQVTAEAAGWEAPRGYDAVLVDAPCSATGTARRHPDVLHLKTVEDLERLTALQDRLLDAGLRALKPGGTMVYAVCSLQRVEGEERIAALLARAPDLRRVPIDAAEIGGWAECVTADGDLRALPCHRAEEGGLDGFYAARLARAEAA